MSKSILIKTTNYTNLVEFLETRDYIVTRIGSSLLQVKNEDLEVFLNIGEKEIFFELDAGEVEALGSEGLYRALLAFNTEILPVSLGLDTTSSKSARLILIESRELQNLDDNEVLSVLEAFEIAYRKLEGLLSKFIACKEERK